MCIPLCVPTPSAPGTATGCPEPLCATPSRHAHEIFSSCDSPEGPECKRAGDDCPCGSQPPEQSGHIKPPQPLQPLQPAPEAAVTEPTRYCHCHVLESCVHIACHTSSHTCMAIRHVTGGAWLHGSTSDVEGTLSTRNPPYPFFCGFHPLGLHGSLDPIPVWTRHQQQRTKMGLTCFRK